MSDDTNTTNTEDTAPSTTEQFKQLLQARMSKILGSKVSKDTAWQLFKSAVGGAFDFAMKQPQDNQRLSLSGVGTFEILQAKPRSDKEMALGFNPRARFYPSSAIQRKVEIFFGLAEGELNLDGAEVEAAAAKAERASKKTASKPKAKKGNASVPAPSANAGIDLESELL